jgi:hypothetical protein
LLKLIVIYVRQGTIRLQDIKAELALGVFTVLVPDTDHEQIRAPEIQVLVVNPMVQGQVGTERTFDRQAGGLGRE